MKLKIIQAGWETYNGPLSEVEFKNGVSVTDVTQLQAERIAAAVRTVVLDAQGNEGEDPGVAAQLVRMTAGTQKPREYEVPGENRAPPAATQSEFNFTRESLEATADQKGINGLRVIADEFGIKSNSVNALIDKLMELKDKNAAQPAKQ